MNSEGEAYVAGYTHSTTFPATKGAYQTTCPGYDVYCGFVTELNSTGEGLVWSTLLGNAGTTSEGTG